MPRALLERLLAVLSDHPEGISIDEIRRELGLTEEQQHLDRRIRELDAKYVIRRDPRGRKTYYVLLGPRDVPLPRSSVDKTTRARILGFAAGRCQMCGRTIEDGIRLEVDHKVPREWGGPTVDENLWALCAECNQGKRNFFSSIADDRIRKAMVHGPVHIRIGELLKAFEGKPVPKAYIQLVAFTHNDYEKRLRELRELGWRYHVTKRREGRRIRTYFTLDHWEPWPSDPAASVREAERRKKRKGS